MSSFLFFRSLWLVERKAARQGGTLSCQLCRENLVGDLLYFCWTINTGQNFCCHLTMIEPYSCINSKARFVFFLLYSIILLLHPCIFASNVPVMIFYSFSSLFILSENIPYALNTGIPFFICACHIQTIIHCHWDNNILRTCTLLLAFAIFSYNPSLSSHSSLSFLFTVFFAKYSQHKKVMNIWLYRLLWKHLYIAFLFMIKFFKIKRYPNIFTVISITGQFYDR